MGDGTGISSSGRGSELARVVLEAVEGIQEAPPQADAEGTSAAPEAQGGWNASRMIGSAVAGGLAQMARVLEASGAAPAASPAGAGTQEAPAGGAGGGGVSLDPSTWPLANPAGSPAPIGQGVPQPGGTPSWNPSTWPLANPSGSPAPIGQGVPQPGGTPSWNPSTWPLAETPTGPASTPAPAGPNPFAGVGAALTEAARDLFQDGKPTAAAASGAGPTATATTFAAPPPGASSFVGGARTPAADPSLLDIVHEKWEREVEGDREMMPPPTLKWGHTEPRAEDIRFGDKVPLSESWNEPPLDVAIDGEGRLDLNKVTPEMLAKLDPTDLKTLMHNIAATTVEGPFGAQFPLATNTNYPNAASAFAAKMLKQGDADLAARLFAAAPEHILPFATGKTLRMLVHENFGRVLNELSASKDFRSGARVETGELAALGQVFQKYLGREVGDDPAAAAEAVQRLMEDVARSGVPLTPETMGVLLGSLIGGMQAHFDAVKLSAEEQKAFMNKVFDAVGKAAGAIPGAGPALALVVKGAAYAYNQLTNPSDHRQLRLNLQAAMKLQLLENPPAGWSDADVSRAIDYLEAALNANGIEA